MKKWIFTLATFVACTGVNAKDNDFAVELMKQEMLVGLANDVTTNNLINWKVGEFLEYDMSAAFGSLGKMKKFVASEQGNAIWVKSEMSGMMGGQTVEALIDRATAQVLEMRQNGKNVEIPKDKLEVISQEPARITVPAGTFDTIHITAKSEKVKKMEAWINPRDTALDGNVQMVVDAGMLVVTMKLTKFGGK